jgi:hypothetical protein
MTDQVHILSADESISLDVRVRADLLHLLFEHSFPAVYVSIVVAMLLCLAMWGEVPHERLVVWLSAICIAGLFRFLLFHLYRRRKPTGLQILEWEMPYAITLFIPSLIWGLGVVWIMNESSRMYQVVAFIYLFGMAGGAVSLYSARRYMAVGTMVCVLMPVTVWLLVRGPALELTLGLASVIFMVMWMRTSSVLSTALVGISGWRTGWKRPSSGWNDWRKQTF